MKARTLTAAEISEISKALISIDINEVEENAGMLTTEKTDVIEFSNLALSYDMTFTAYCESQDDTYEHQGYFNVKSTQIEVDIEVYDEDGAVSIPANQTKQIQSIIKSNTYIC